MNRLVNPARLARNVLKSNKRIPVTICISAIAEHGVIIGCADTMMTDESKGIEFELRESSSGNSYVNKISQIDKGIVALTAGAFGLQTEIISEIIFKTLKEQNPNPSVKGLVDLYCQIYGRIKKDRINKAVLLPLGLDSDSFISRQHEMTPDFIQMVSNEIWKYELPATQTIIAGSDDDGPHLFSLTADQYFNCNSAGFCAIGSGASHAESQFMLAGYHRNESAVRNCSSVQKPDGSAKSI